MSESNDDHDEGEQIGGTDGSGDRAQERLPDRAWTLALMTLPHIGPRRLSALRGPHTSEAAWSSLVGGIANIEVAPDQRDQIIRAARGVDVQSLWRRHVDAGIQVVVAGDADFPASLIGDPEPPPALLAQGDLQTLRSLGVAVVGTRRCTPYGRSVATEIGRRLSEVGVSVISGLALGIDAAAHAGAITAGGAGPVGVVAGGFERPVPLANQGLYEQVVEAGVVVSETPLGAPVSRWRFPARNRIVAALSAAVVVVESAEVGGSMYTVDEALRRDRPVFAVPGSVRSPMSAGTNRLIRDGAIPYTDFDDLLAEVDHLLPSVAAPASTTKSGQVELSPDARLLLGLISHEPELVDDLVARSGLSVGRAIAALDALLRGGLIDRSGAVVQRLDQG